MSARQKLMSKEHDEEKPMSLINIFSRKQNSRLLSDTDTALAKRFEHFRGFLLANRSALNGIAELEQLYYAGAPTSKSHITSYLKTLEGSISELLLRLNALGKNRYAMLPERMHNIFSGITSLSTISLPASLALVVPLSSLRAGDEVYAGSKACNLGILRGTLAITVPDGFAVTAGAFIQFIEDNGLRPLLEQELGEVDASDLAKGEAACTRIRDAILQAPVPALLAEKILGAYEALEGRTRPGVGSPCAAAPSGRIRRRLSPGSTIRNSMSPDQVCLMPTGKCSPASIRCEPLCTACALGWMMRTRQCALPASLWWTARPAGLPIPLILTRRLPGRCAWPLLQGSPSCW